MNNDNLKDFINSRRDEFDQRTPSKSVWRRIERSLFGSTTIDLWNSVAVWRAAAVVLLGLSILMWVGQRMPDKAAADLASQQEFRDVESFYSAQISEKVSILRQDAGFEEDTFTQDLEKLEAMYAVLAEEMKRHPSQKVKDALVLNMLVRIDLLNQQIHRLEESKKKPDIGEV